MGVMLPFNRLLSVAFHGSKLEVEISKTALNVMIVM